MRIAALSVMALTALVSNGVGAQDISLESLLDVPVETASRYRQTARQAPASVSVVSAVEIESFGYKTLADVLRSVRGLYITNDRNYEYAGVRGFSRPTDYNNRILVLLNGIPQNEYVFGSAAIGWDLGLSMENVDRIEIIRGPGSVLYGTSAMFGVINIITKDERQDQGGGVSVAAGNYGGRQVSAFVNEDLGAGTRLSVSAMHFRAAGESLYFDEFSDSNGGMAVDADWERSSGVHSVLSRGGLRLEGRVAHRRKGVPTASYETTFGMGEEWTADSRQYLGVSYRTQTPRSWSATVGANLSRHGYEGSFPYDDEEGSYYDSFDEAVGTNYGADGQIQWDLSPRSVMVGGVGMVRHVRASYRYYDEWEEYSSFNEPLTVGYAFLQGAFDISPAASMVVGGRYDQYSTTGSGFTPRAALVVSPWSRHVLKFLYGAAFRVPTAYELFYADPVLDFVANPSLLRERVSTLEAVWEHQISSRGTVATSVYRTVVSDLIDSGETQFDNVGSVRSHGAELEVRTAGTLSGFASVAYQHSIYLDSKEHLSNAPEILFKAGAVIGRTGWSGGAQLFGESSRFTIWGDRLDGSTRLDLMLRTPDLIRGVRLAVKLQNALDAQIFLPGGYEHTQAAIIQPGRSVRFEIRTSL